MGAQGSGYLERGLLVHRTGERRASGRSHQFDESVFLCVLHGFDGARGVRVLEHVVRAQTSGTHHRVLPVAVVKLTHVLAVIGLRLVPRVHPA